jgi:hypothetical protein
MLLLALLLLLLLALLLLVLPAAGLCLSAATNRPHILRWAGQAFRAQQGLQ